MSNGYQTIETGLSYVIEHGRQNPIHLTEIGPTLPPRPPAAATQPTRSALLMLRLRRLSGTERLPNHVRLTLWEPKQSSLDVDEPPSFVGHGPAGNYTLRYPAGDDTVPRYQDTPLWQEYVEPNWRSVPGGPFEYDDMQVSVAREERDNTDWPGERHSSLWRPPEREGLQLATDEVYLRVTKQGILIDGINLLMMLEIRRFGRLRLLARPFFVPGPEVVSGSGRPICFIATAAYGSPGAKEVKLLRALRDEQLARSRLGRILTNIYYRASPPIASLVMRSGFARRLARGLLRPVIRFARRYHPD